MKFLKKNRPYYIAEIGINHNGFLSLTKKMILAAKKAGADAVKFQKRDADELVANGDYKKNPIGYLSKNEFDIKKEKIKFGGWTYPDIRLELKDNDYKKIKKLCKKIKIDLIITPWDDKSLNFINKLGVTAIKIASIDATNYQFCTKVAKLKKNTIISTGMTNYDEVIIIDKIFRKNNCKHIFLHCTSSYPSEEKDKNLNCILKLQKILKSDVGFSGHGLDIAGPVGATALGAKIIEKHVTLNKKMHGPDHSASIEFPEFKRMVELCNKVSLSMGTNKKRFLKSEKTLHSILSRKFVASSLIRKGSRIKDFNINTAVVKRGLGILPKDYFKILNKKTKKNIHKGNLINYKDLF